MKICTSTINNINLFFNADNGNQNDNQSNEAKKEFVDKSTSTDYNQMYYEENGKDDILITEKAIEENNDSLNINNLTKKKRKKKRKYDTDLIRNKIFIYFNKMLYNWLIKAIPDDEKKQINQISLNKINKEKIRSLMSKTLKSLVLLPEEAENEFDDKLLHKLGYKYQELYNLFISKSNDLVIDNDLFQDFYHLENYLSDIRKIEDNEYIAKVRKVATEYEKWMNNKVHLFKKNKLKHF
jgi:hypothetical protein